jgi:hypothetical protein
VNASNSLSIFINFPTAVQFPGDAHDTEVKNPERDTCCWPVSNTAGRAVSHTPFVDVMVNASVTLLLFRTCPTAVQFPGDAHDTELNSPYLASSWIALTTAGRAVSHTPFVEVMVDASKPALLFLNIPAAVQFPGDAHDTELNNARGELLWIPASNTAGRALVHTSFVDVMVKASESSPLFRKIPTAVQFPGDEHDTEKRASSGDAFWSPVLNCAGRALPNSPLVDVMVKACVLSLTFLKDPTAVQFPGEEHDTEYKNALGELLWIPASNTAGRAVLQTSLVDVMLNASKSPLLFLNCPTTVQFPGEEHDTEDVYISCGEERRMPS